LGGGKISQVIIYYRMEMTIKKKKNKKKNKKKKHKKKTREKKKTNKKENRKMVPALGELGRY